jgi:hypothetical protein
MDDNTVNQETPSTDANSADLTINDLAAVKSIIDVASQRGAFKPNEMVAVGTVYSKIESFLNAAQAAAKAPANNA